MRWGLFKKNRVEVNEGDIDKKISDKLRDEQIKKLEAALSDYESKRRSFVNDLNDKRRKVSELESAIVIKKNEYDCASINVKPIIAGEISNLVKNLELQKVDQNIILEQMRQFDVLIAKTNETIHLMRTQGLDQIAAELAAEREIVQDNRIANSVAIGQLEQFGLENEQDDLYRAPIVEERQKTANTEAMDADVESMCKKALGETLLN